MRIKTAIRAAFRKIGLDVHRYSPPVLPVPPEAPARPSPRIVTSLQVFGIDLVLDVGANQGQFASEIRRGGYAGKIVSFEPLSETREKLLEVSDSDTRWKIYPQCALGDRDGVVEINIAGNSLSSSILPMLESHRGAAPGSSYQGKETVPIKRIDTVVKSYVKKSRSIFLKIDTQGYEWQVLDGARNTLPILKGMLVELSLVPLYEGQYLWLEMIERIEAAGFSLWSLEPVFHDPFNGRTLQVDGVFFRDPEQSGE